MISKMRNISFSLWKFSIVCFLLSLPLPSPALAADPDEYEEDDSFYQAKPILVEGEVQSHNFHQDGNEDWVFFEGEAGKKYKILRTQNVDVEMCDSNYGCLPVSSRNELDGTLSFTYNCSSNGDYFVKVTNKSGMFNDGMMYDIWVNPVNAPNPDARIGGLVYQAGTLPNIPIGNVSLQIKGTDYSGSFIRVGYYVTPRVFPVGTYTVTAKADGYKQVTKQVSVSVAGKSLRCDIPLELESSQPLIKTFYRDGDGDGFGTNSPPTKIRCIYCGPEGYVENSDDCNDNDKAMNTCGNGSSTTSSSSTSSSTSTSTTNSTVPTTVTTTSTSTTVPTTTTTSTSTTVPPTTSTTIVPTTTTSSTINCSADYQYDDCSDNYDEQYDQYDCADDDHDKYEYYRSADYQHYGCSDNHDEQYHQYDCSDYDHVKYEYDCSDDGNDHFDKHNSSDYHDHQYDCSADDQHDGCSDNYDEQYHHHDCSDHDKYEYYCSADHDEQYHQYDYFDDGSDHFDKHNGSDYHDHQHDGCSDNYDKQYHQYDYS